MTSISQKTLAGELEFCGGGLHTGRKARMILKPAPENTGVIFHRVDLGEDAFVQAVAGNVSSTARSTTISGADGVTVSTIEHLMSALTGMGVDNALVEIDNVEVPILDGSAAPFVSAIGQIGLSSQNSPRQFLQVPEEIEVTDEKTGSFIRVTPSGEPSIDLTVDFGSKVLGVQRVHWDPGVDYASQIAPCRTFVFFHEIEYLFQNNLVKGGDVDNAIVIVEHPVSEEQVERLSRLFNVPKLAIDEKGYLNNISLHFPDECGRHKLLDLLGDLRLAGGWLGAKVTAFKPGHTINTRAAEAIRQAAIKMN